MSTQTESNFYARKFSNNNPYHFISSGIPEEKIKNNFVGDFQKLNDEDCNLSLSLWGGDVKCEGINVHNTTFGIIDSKENWKICNQPAIGSEIKIENGKKVKYCKYNKNFFGEENFREYYDKFGANHNSADKLYNDFCSRNVRDINGNICLEYKDNYGLNVKNNNCLPSRTKYNSVYSDYANACRNWEKNKFLNNEGETIYNLRKSWCGYNKEEPDCSCISRLDNKDFIKAKQVFGVDKPDYCWYPPCKLGTDSLLDINITNLKCPNICEFIINLDNINHAEISKITPTFDCGYLHTQIPRPKNNLHIDNIPLSTENTEPIINIKKDFNNLAILVGLSLIFIFLLFKK